MEARFLAAIWDSPTVREKLEQTARTTAGIFKVNQQDLNRVALPLPPLAEQRRIGDEIEKQFTRLDAAVAGLKRIQASLKRYRASVLKAACEGRLVPTEAELARREGRGYETGEQLLKRILVERRARWEADQAERMKVAGKAAKDPGWKSRYEEPAVGETSDLGALPAGWVWAALSAPIWDIEAGRSFRCLERPPLPGETGVVKVSAVTWGSYDEEETKTCTDLDRVDNSLLVRPGDFLFSRANTIDLVGNCVIARQVTRRAMLSDKILRFRLALLAPEWLLLTLRSGQGRAEIRRLATGNQESMRNIGQDRIRQIRLPLPPIAEQARISAEVDRRLSVVEELESTIHTNLARCARLRQSILKRAFEGKLVPQDPNDEPASVLLARLRKERDENPGRPAKRKPRRAGD